MNRPLTTRPLRRLALIVLSTLAAWAGAAVHAQGGAEPLKIGIISPMSGPNARYGAFANRGAALAAREINAAGGVLGHPVALASGDSQCVPAEGVAATQRLISLEKTPIIIGDVCSSVTLAMQPLVEEAQVLLVNAASSNPDITYKAGAGGFKWTFRNYPTDELRAAVVLEHSVKARGFKKFAVLSVDSDYGRGAIQFTKRYLPQYPDVQILSEDYYKDSETDFRSVLSKIRRSGAQAIILYGQADTTPIIARQMLEMGLAGKVALVGNAEFSTRSTIQAAPSVINGAVEAAAWIPEYDSPASRKFVADYQQAYGGEVPSIQAYSPYETIKLIAQAARNANSIAARDIREALTRIEYDSAMGKVTFDDHNQAVLPMVLIEVQDGHPVVKGAITTQVDYASATGQAAK